jgi:hypothetical protein
LSRYRAFSRLALALVAVLAASAGGCSNWAVVDEIKEGDYFNKPLYTTPDWLRPNHANRLSNLSKRGPVQPDELVNAAGQCAPKPVPVVQAQAPASPPAQAPQEATEPQQPVLTPAEARAKAQVGSVAGDLAGAPMPEGPPPAPPPAQPRRQLASAKPHEVMDGLQPEGTSSSMAGTGGTLPLSGIALGMSECQVARRAGSPSHVEIGVGTKGERKVVLTYLTGAWPGIYTFRSGRLNTVDAAPDQLKAQEPKKRKHGRRVSAKGREDVYVQ